MEKNQIKALKARRYRAMRQPDFSNPYGRSSITGLTPAKVVDDFVNNPDTKFNLSQYLFAEAELELSLFMIQPI